MGRHIMVQQDKCKACHQCESACVAAHFNMTSKEARKLRAVFAPRCIFVEKNEEVKTAVRCHQCDDAPCCTICPTGALRETENGHVFSPELCIDCEMCVKACPYGAVNMEMLPVEGSWDREDGPTSCVYPGRKIAVRCDLCTTWRMKNGKKITACMEACPAQAIVLVEEDGSITAPPSKVNKAVGDKVKKEVAAK